MTATHIFYKCVAFCYLKNQCLHGILYSNVEWGGNRGITF